MGTKLTESKNGATVEVTTDNGKCLINIYGRRTPKTVKIATHLQYSMMPPAWVMRQILKTL